MGIVSKISGLKQVLHFDNRIELLIRRLFFSGSTLVEYQYKGHRILIDHGARDECGIRPCLLGPMYRVFLRQMKLGKHPKILDIGANAGGFSLMLAVDGLNPEKLVVVEMNPMTCARLRLNMYMNLFPLPTVINAALAGDSRTISIPYTQGGTGQSIYETVADGKTLLIKGVTLDEVISENFGADEIDLCKIDIEGAEYEVFESDTWHKLAQCRNILIEIHKRDGKRTDFIKEAILSQGFTEIEVPGREAEDVYCFTKHKP